MKTYVASLALAISTVLLAACGGSDSDSGSPGPEATSPGPEATSSAAINPADFTSVIDNPLFPISSYTTMVYEGEETDPDTGETVLGRVEMTVLPDTKVVAGVEVLVVQDQAFEDGELVESTLDYYAQHTDGSVYYFGEDVDNYLDGELANHDGSWIAGEGENLPGIIMPPAPAVGDVFEQEKAPGIAEDRMTILSLTETVTVPAGTYTDCLKSEDVNPLDGTGAIEFKYYCPGVGFALEEFEEGTLELISLE
jgi:hypothetical protein